MNRCKVSAAQLVPGVALSLLIVGVLLYAAVHYDRPAESEVNVSHTLTDSTQATHTESETTSILSVTTTLCYDLYLATADDLMRVDGIGPALANRILNARTQRGGFQRRSDLLVVNGVGERLMERIMEEFYIANELPPIVTVTTTMPAATETKITVTAGRYDLNLVTKEELMRIPDMTEALADGILELRTVIQYYTHLYEVLYVDGMNGAYVENVLANHLYVTSQTTTAATTDTQFIRDSAAG